MCVWYGLYLYVRVVGFAFSYVCDRVCIFMCMLLSMYLYVRAVEIVFLCACGGVCIFMCMWWALYFYVRVVRLVFSCACGGVCICMCVWRGLHFHPNSTILHVVQVVCHVVRHELNDVGRHETVLNVHNTTDVFISVWGDVHQADVMILSDWGNHGVWQSMTYEHSKTNQPRKPVNDIPIYAASN